MKARAIAAALALALALTGCGRSGEGPGPAVRWEMLAEEPENRAERWYDHAAPELITSDSYGLLVPYIGGEASAVDGETGWMFGLATREGLIVTDPVYTEVSLYSWYDALEGCNRSCPALVLRSAVPRETPPPDNPDIYYGSAAYDDRYGLAALDGSRYTGQIFTDIIAYTENGCLGITADGGALMLSLDFEELWSWEPGALPLDGLLEAAQSWQPFQLDGGWLAYIPDWREDETPEAYVNLADGSVQTSEPEGFGEAGDASRADSLYDGGRYYVRGRDIIIRTNAGEEYAVSPDYGQISTRYDISGDRLLTHGGEGTALYDFTGRELRRFPGDVGFFRVNEDTPALIQETEYLIDGDGAAYPKLRMTIYDRDGRLLMEADGPAEQFHDRLLMVDGGSYRLTDLEGRDLIRLTRPTADIPAEE